MSKKAQQRQKRAQKVHKKSFKTPKKARKEQLFHMVEEGQHEPFHASHCSKPMVEVPAGP